MLEAATHLQSHMASNRLPVPREREGVELANAVSARPLLRQSAACFRDDDVVGAVPLHHRRPAPADARGERFRLVATGVGVPMGVTLLQQLPAKLDVLVRKSRHRRNSRVGASAAPTNMPTSMPTLGIEIQQPRVSLQRLLGGPHSASAAKRSLRGRHHEPGYMAKSRHITLDLKREAIAHERSKRLTNMTRVRNKYTRPHVMQKLCEKRH